MGHVSKKELARRMKEKGAAQSIYEAQSCIDAVFEEIADALKNGEDVNLGKNIGIKFTVVERKARKGRNPSTGEIVEIPPRKAVKAVFSKKSGMFLLEE